LSFGKSNYSYNSNKHVVIPCTLNADFENVKLSSQTISQKRKELNLPDDDTVYVYSGSVAVGNRLMFCIHLSSHF